MERTSVDAYTKAMLTLVAACLMLLTIHQLDLIPKAYAKEPGISAVFPGGNFGLIPLNEDGSITVRVVAGDELDVNIAGISTSDELEVDISAISTSDELDVNLDEIGGRFLSSGGPVPVALE